MVVLLISLIMLSACKKKKPDIPQPQSQAPTITEPVPQPQPLPQPSPQPLPQPQPPATTTQKPATASIPKPKPRKHVAKKPTQPAPAPSEKSRTTVKEGGDLAPSGQLSAGIPQDEASRQRQSAAQLRQSTETNLRGLTRNLSSDEQSMVQQIRTYLAQSRTADNDGDIERSYNLALKAHLLSEGLIKH